MLDTFQVIILVILTDNNENKFSTSASTIRKIATFNSPNRVMEPSAGLDHQESDAILQCENSTEQISTVISVEKKCSPSIEEEDTSSSDLRWDSMSIASVQSDSNLAKFDTIDDVSHAIGKLSLHLLAVALRRFIHKILHTISR